jgi:hypothetical protein
LQLVMLRWLRRPRERDDRGLVKSAATLPDIDQIDEWAESWQRRRWASRRRPKLSRV